VIAPKLNEPDLDEFPETLLADVEFLFVDSIDTVLDEALERPPPARARRTRPRVVTPERAAARSR
jgi:ATP-dependent Lon protease